jgi:hypothetical protein
LTTERTTYTARTENRHVERLTDETLVYDIETDQVLRLDPVAAAVWAACARPATATEIEVATGLGTSRIDQALSELAASGLLDVADGGLSRRDFGVKLGIGAVAIGGAALVTGIAAPTPASASSGDGGGGSGGNN